MFPIFLHQYEAVTCDITKWFFFFFFFVVQVLAVQPPSFASCLNFWNQSSHVENQTEPASQIPEVG
jgi:hypothetical protein